MRATILTAILVVITTPALAQTWNASPPDNNGSYIVRGPNDTQWNYSGDGRGDYTVRESGQSGFYTISRDPNGGALIQSHGADFSLPGQQPGQ